MSSHPQNFTIHCIYFRNFHLKNFARNICTHILVSVHLIPTIQETLGSIIYLIGNNCLVTPLLLLLPRIESQTAKSFMFMLSELTFDGIITWWFCLIFKVDLCYVMFLETNLETQTIGLDPSKYMITQMKTETIDMPK